MKNRDLRLPFIKKGNEFVAEGNEKRLSKNDLHECKKSSALFSHKWNTRNTNENIVDLVAKIAKRKENAGC